MAVKAYLILFEMIPRIQFFCSMTNLFLFWSQLYVL